MLSRTSFIFRRKIFTSGLKRLKIACPLIVGRNRGMLLSRSAIAYSSIYFIMVTSSCSLSASLEAVEIAGADADNACGEGGIGKRGSGSSVGGRCSIGGIGILEGGDLADLDVTLMGVKAFLAAAAHDCWRKWFFFTLPRLR